MPRRANRRWPRGRGPARGRSRSPSPRPDRPAPAGRRVGGGLAEQGVLGATADQVDDVDHATGQLGPPADAVGVGPGQGVDHTAHRLGRTHRGGETGAHRAGGDALGHRARSQERGIVHVDQRAAGGQARRLAEQPVQVVLLAPLGPSTQRLLQQPEAAGVAQEADPVVHPELVGEVLPARRLGEDGTGGQLHADERPGAARDVGEAVGGGGHAGHGRRGVVRAHRGDHDAGRQAQPLPQLGPHRPEDRPRRHQRREQLGTQPQACDQLERPLAGMHVEQPRGGCVSALGAQLAGQPVGQQVGQQGEGRRLRPQRAAALARQLVKGGEGEELQPVAREELVGRHEGVHRVHHLGRAVVPVRRGLGQQPALGIEQAVVDAPGVDADRLHLRIALGQRAQSCQHLVVESGHGPAQPAVHLAGAVGEAVHGVHRERPALDQAGHDAPA